MSNVYIKLLNELAKMPQAQSERATGFDLFACIVDIEGITDSITIYEQSHALIGCGFAMEVPYFIDAQVRPRSGLALKHGVTVLNSPGTIDPDYRGEVGVILQNTTNYPFEVRHGDRIAQLVFVTRPLVRLNVVDELGHTARGQGGFGSTGI